jgi:hypothetical protein
MAGPKNIRTPSSFGAVVGSGVRDPGSRMDKKSGSRIRDNHPGCATLQYFTCSCRILQRFAKEPASVGWCCCWIRDPGWIKIRIRDPGCLSRMRNTAIFCVAGFFSGSPKRAGVSRLVALLLDPGSGMDKNQDPGYKSPGSATLQYFMWQDSSAVRQRAVVTRLVL